jgi:hypothetical protein
MNKKCFLRLLAIFFIVICYGINLRAANQVWYPILQLDAGRGHDPAECEPNFYPFMIADSGSEFDGIKVTLTSENMDARWRGAPTGVPFELIYRDFIFFRPMRPGVATTYPWTGETIPLTLTLTGLVPNQAYEITIFSYDTSSAGNRVSDWIANGDFLFQITMSQANTPTSKYSSAYSAMTQADSTGKIDIVATIGAAQLADSGQYNQPFAFINGLEVYSTIPRYMALRPTPAIGATVTTSAFQLQWRPGAEAAKHNVYVGEVYADVDTATTVNTNIFRGTTTTNSLDIVLSPGKTYYWRVDEVKANGTVTKGYIWNFFVASLTAYNPIPVDTSLFADPNCTLRWSAGAGATSHHVYFGDNLQNVQTGTGGTDKGTVANVRDVNLPIGMLQRNKTYYWCVDEIAGAETRQGAVWSFTTSPVNLGTVICDIWENISGSTLDQLLADPRYPDNPTTSTALTSFSYGTADGVGNNYGGRIHGWLYVPLTGNYTFYFTSADEGELWLSTDDDPANLRPQPLAAERTWGNFNVFSHKSDPVSLIGGNKYYIRAIWKEGGDWDHCQAAWIGAGVRGVATNPPIIAGNYLSPYEPTSATAPRPADGDPNVSQTPILSWNPGLYAASHNVYFGSDQSNLTQVATSPLGQEQYGPITPALDPNKTYYWRIDEVNDLRTGGPWVGKVWSFTTAPYLVVDDFEYYDDANNQIFFTWEDYVVNNTGMTVGHFVAPYAEQTIVHDGSQSMFLHYDNDGTVNEGVVIDNISYEQSGTQLYSEAQRTWAEPQDWSQGGAVKSLMLWFRGIPATYGSFVEGPPTWILTARGADITGEADEFFFVHKLFSGNGAITVKVDSLTRTDGQAKAGVMMRESLTAGSKYAMIAITPEWGVYFQRRITDNAGSDTTRQAGINTPQWLKLTRNLNTFTAEYSATGTANSWTQLGSIEITMAADVYVGLCLTSHNIDETCTGNFSSVTLPATATGQWSYGDIGIQSNIAEQLYVMLQDSANSALVKYQDPNDPTNFNATTIDVWTQWNIPVTSFTGVNMQAINKMTIGVGDPASTQPGSAGDLYIDDIGLIITP